MKANAFFSTCGVLALLTGTSAVPAQDTTLQVGTFGFSPSDPPDVQQVSTSQIDPVLTLVDASRFGTSYTRDRANRMFSDIDALRSSLQAELAATLSNIDNTSLDYLVVTTNPVNVRFNQTPAGVRARVGNFSVDLSLTFDHWVLDVFFPLFCSSLTGTARLNNLAVTTEYSIAAGLLQNSSADYQLSNVGASCGGLFGFVGDFFLNVFGINGTLRQLVTERVRDRTISALRMADGREIFSAREFLEGLRGLAGSGLLNSLANDAIDAGQRIVANPTGLNAWLQLDILVSQSASGNLIRFLASHGTRSHVVNYEVGAPTWARIEVSPGEDSGRVDVFARARGPYLGPGPTYAPGNGPWIFLGSTSDGYLELVGGGLEVGTQIGAIGVSSHFSRLRSELGELRTVSWDYSCQECGPYIAQ